MVAVSLAKICRGRQLRAAGLRGCGSQVVKSAQPINKVSLAGSWADFQRMPVGALGSELTDGRTDQTAPSPPSLSVNSMLNGNRGRPPRKKSQLAGLRPPLAP